MVYTVTETPVVEILNIFDNTPSIDFLQKILTEISENNISHIAPSYNNGETSNKSKKLLITSMLAP